MHVALRGATLGEFFLRGIRAPGGERRLLGMSAGAAILGLVKTRLKKSGEAVF